MFVSHQNYFGLLHYLLIISFFALTGCQKQGNNSESPTFYDNLQAMCKKKYSGSVVYPAGREAPFQGKKIWIEVTACSPKEIRIPINTGDKVYRTLVLGKSENGVWLQHENKRPDGSQAEISLYGGQASNQSSPYLLVFPADSYTKQLLGAERNSSWSLAISSDKTTLSYIAESDGRLDLQLDFDLTAAL